MNASRRALVAAGATTGVLVVFAVLAANIAWDPQLTGYRHRKPYHIQLRLDDWPLAFSAASITRAPTITTDNQLDNVPKTQTLSWTHVAGGGTVRLPFDRNAEADTSAAFVRYVVLVAPSLCVLPLLSFVAEGLGLDCDSPKHLEIEHQTPRYLESVGIHAPLGFSIAARRSFDLPARNRTDTTVVPHYSIVRGTIGGPPQQILDGLPQSAPEIYEAIKIVSHLYSEPVRIGSDNAAHPRNRDVPPEQRLKHFRRGTMSVMCAEFRNLFLDFAARNALIGRVRPVNAFNYFPPFRDLVPYSHALAEIYVQSWERWVLVDPWLGFMLSIDGRLVDVEELSSLPRHDLRRVRRVPIVDKVRRYAAETADAPRRLKITPPLELAVPMMSSIDPATRHFTIGYTDYFRAVHYGPVHTRWSE